VTRFPMMGLAVWLWSATTGAAVDSYGLGDGHHGALEVRAPNTRVNSYAVLTQSAAQGSSSVETAASANFTAGDLILFLQVKGDLSNLDSGVQKPFDVEALGGSALEFARVVGLCGSTLALDAPLHLDHPALLTQLVMVPEYTDVSISDGGSIVPLPWDGYVGGVVAFLASGTIRNDGRIDASGRGFRGGAGLLRGSELGCTGLDAVAPNGGPKGEGIAAARFGPGFAGRGNIANGAGGANCRRTAWGDPLTGGGGGGHGGRGGNGGGPTAGLGGAAARYDMLVRVTFGGGGGASASTASSAQPSGAPGGGAVLLRGAAMAGSGSVAADGLAGYTSDGQNNTGSGGGAGGAISLRMAGPLAVASVLARGGSGGGGSVTYGWSGAGAGAGGRVLLQSSLPTTAVSVTAGTGGHAALDGEPASPFEPTALGDVTILSSGYGAPPVPTVTAPTAHEVLAATRATFAGTAASDAGVAVHLDGRWLGQTFTSHEGL
jgi:hypothetical protein